MAVSSTRYRKSSSERDASSAENSTSSAYLRARRTDSRVSSSTSSGVFFSLYFMCRSLVAITTCMRLRFALANACAAASISPGTARHIEHTTGAFTAAATA